MSKTYYNIPGCEELEAFLTSSLSHVEDKAAELLSSGGVIADGTRGSAAEAHGETTQITDQISGKAQDVIAMIHGVVKTAKEETISTDMAGAGMTGWQAAGH